MKKAFVAAGIVLVLLCFGMLARMPFAHAATTCDLVADTNPAGSSYLRCQDNGGGLYRVFPRQTFDMLTTDMPDAAAASFTGSFRFYGDIPTDIAWAQQQYANGMKLAFGGLDKANKPFTFAQASNYAAALCPYVVGLSVPDEGLGGDAPLTVDQMNTIVSGFRSGCPSALIFGDFYQAETANWYNQNADVIGYDGYPGYAGPNWGQEINIEAWSSDFATFRSAITASKPIWLVWLPGWGSTVWDLPQMTFEESKTTVLLAIAMGANGAAEFPWCVDDYDCGPNQNLPDTTYEWPIATYIQNLLTQPLLYANDATDVTITVSYQGSPTTDIKKRLKRKNGDYLMVASQYRNGPKKNAAHFRGLARKNLTFCFAGKTVTSVTNVEDNTVYPVSNNCFTEPDIGRIGVAQVLGANHTLGGSTMYAIKAQ